MKSGVMIRTGMVIPAPNPNNAENMLPAQVGHPTNNPPVKPML